MWGGDAEHEHSFGEVHRLQRSGVNHDGGAGYREREDRKYIIRSGLCACGSWLGSLGLEPTPEIFVAHLVECFRAVRRVLRDDGVLWVNMGDSYAGSGKGPTGHNGIGDQSKRQGSSNGAMFECEDCGITRHIFALTSGCPNCGETMTPLARRTGNDKSDSNRGSLKYNPLGGKPTAGYKAKDLMEIPSMVAQALRADGWYLRSRIPWLKRNAMPESVSDRPASSVEYVFLLSKSARYYWDADAVRSADKGKDNPRTNLDAWNPSGGVANPHQGLRVAESRNGTGRNRRNGDWFFESWRGLLLDEDDAPMALVVNPAPFSAARLEHAYGGGKSRTVSPDCPVHGAPAELADDRTDGGPPSASRSGHSPHNDVHPDQSPASELPATRTDLAASRADSPIATGRSKRTSKTDSQSGAPSAGAGAMFSGTEYSGVRPASLATYDRTPESNNDPDDSTAHPLAQTSGRSAHTGALGQESEPGVIANEECYSEANSTAEASHSDRVTQTPDRNDRTCSCRIVDHYAVFPPKLVEPMVKASTSERGQCPECGAPWVRVVEKHIEFHQNVLNAGKYESRPDPGHHMGSDRQKSGHVPGHTVSNTTGWRPSCGHVGPRSEDSCDHPCDEYMATRECQCTVYGGYAGPLLPVPQIILDPFAGSGTTLMVADRLGRNAIGCELSSEYSDLGTGRVVGDAPMFVDLESA